MILFLIIGIAVWVGVLCRDIVSQPAIPPIVCGVLLLLCVIMLCAISVTTDWIIKYNYWRTLCRRIDANKITKTK